MTPAEASRAEHELASINTQIRELEERRTVIIGNLAEYDLDHGAIWADGKRVPLKPIEDLPPLSDGRSVANAINDIKEA